MAFASYPGQEIETKVVKCNKHVLFEDLKTTFTRMITSTSSARVMYVPLETRSCITLRDIFWFSDIIAFGTWQRDPCAVSKFFSAPHLTISCTNTT